MDSMLNELIPETPSATLLEIDHVTEVVWSDWFKSYLEAIDHCRAKYKIPHDGWCICSDTLQERPSGFRVKLKHLVDETLTLWIIIPVILKPGRHFSLPCGFCK